MQKIPTIFIRDPDTNLRHVKDEPHPACGWVFAGEGRATRKWDGTCVMVDEAGDLWARRVVRPGKAEPPNFRLVEHDANTGKDVGWEPADQSSFWKYIQEAAAVGELKPGTYELCGPKVNGNPEGFGVHVLIYHGVSRLSGVPRTLAELGEWLHAHDYEGVVWHHPDGRMAKIKRRDFPVNLRASLEVTA